MRREIAARNAPAANRASSVKRKRKGAHLMHCNTPMTASKERHHDTRPPARVAVVALLLLLCACTPAKLTNFPDQLSQMAREQMLNTFAGQYRQRLGNSVDSVINELGRAGAYLDNPLVRILLPPPVGLVLGSVRDLRADPQAALLETLMNQVAAQAIPGAAPVLRAALQQITPAEARTLLEGDVTAGSDYLKTKTAAALQAALRPAVADQLTANGATAVYSELVDVYDAQRKLGAADASVPTPEPAPELAQYVTERAVDGLFATLSAREAQIRKDLDRATGGLLQRSNNPTP